MFAGVSFRADEEGKVKVYFDKEDINVVNDLLSWPFDVTFKINGNKITVRMTKEQAESLYAQLGQCLQEADRADIERGIKRGFEE